MLRIAIRVVNSTTGKASLCILMNIARVEVTKKLYPKVMNKESHG